MSIHQSAEQSASTLVKDTPKKLLKLKELSQKISLKISENLQRQIYSLCSSVPEDKEWSGTLFYSTKGEFGNDNFEIVAESLYLLDIGTHSYTEYDMSKDPDFIQFLMKNPQILTKNKGHIHSHNTMSVFFSSTDDSELIDNSEFHNFYLSLIVNNDNNMIAKVAFRANAIGSTTQTIKFNGVNGKETTKKIVDSFEETFVYYYNCQIDNPYGAGDELLKRVEVLRKKSEEREREKEKARKEQSSHQRNFDFGIDDIAPWGGRSLNYPVSIRPHTNGASYYKKETRSDPRTYTMLLKLLNLDFLYEGGSVESTVKYLEDKYYPDVPELGVENDVNIYLDALESRAISFYVDSFPEDQHLVGFDTCMEKCVEIVEFYESEYPSIVGCIGEALNIVIDNDGKK